MHMNSYNAKTVMAATLLFALLVSACGSSNSPNPWRPPPGGAPPRQGSLTIDVEEGGQVTTSPDIGTCVGRAQCEYQRPLGEVITLTAVPDVGFEFEEWELCDGPSGLQCVTTIEETRFIKAEFDPL